MCMSRSGRNTSRFEHWECVSSHSCILVLAHTNAFWEGSCLRSSRLQLQGLSGPAPFESTASQLAFSHRSRSLVGGGYEETNWDE